MLNSIIRRKKNGVVFKGIKKIIQIFKEEPDEKNIGCLHYLT
jgi:hypothetical protein